MSASGGNETALLGSFARKQVKYGSTCKFDDCGVEEPTAGVAARDSAPAPVVMTRQVKHSLQRHERDHEEIFQL
ncbi:hypothetical protein HPB52_024687 [Rhipicephalus sanguineus]|uniref:Uncharacterized protein n=1 Tax=Rhipicephalus sanguineus TaxID=34632 RepID=A0A9D4YRY4_RHISA|nr:hypothetical protein HPB52_024687 [Rhipicephalus sanguineus]